MQKTKLNPHPTQRQKYLVKTTFGNSLLVEGTHVYARLGGEYAKMEVSTVAKGIELLHLKEGIPGLTLDDITPLLAQSSRYAATAPVLFKHEENGSFTTAFSAALWEGLQANQSWLGEDAGVFGGPVKMRLGLNADQQTAAANIIRALLVENGGPAISADHIRDGWLAGKVVSPRERERAIRALEAFAPEVLGLLDEKFSKAYGIYVTLRQGIMRSISTILGGGSKEDVSGAHDETRDTGSEHISIKPELRLVVDYFASNISTKFASAPVLEIRQIEPKEEGGIERTPRLLRRGIATGEIRDPLIKVKTVERMGLELIALNILCETELAGYIILKHPPESLIFPELHRTTERKEKDKIGARARDLLLPQVQSILGFDDYAAMHKLAIKRAKKAGIEDTYLSNVPVSAQEGGPLMHQFISELHSGVLDLEQGLETGSLLSLFVAQSQHTAYFSRDITYLDVVSAVTEAKKSKSVQTGRVISTKTEELELRKVKERLARARVLKDSNMPNAREIIEVLNDLEFGKVIEQARKMA